MMQRLGAFWSASALLGTAFIALSTIQGVSAANALSFDDWANVSGGHAHTCGVRQNGKLYCWGYDANGQLGDGGANSGKNAPERIGTAVDWTSVSAGTGHTCGLRGTGRLYCWGYDIYGQVGDGNDTGANAPRRVGVFADWAVVSAGENHTCGVRKNGKLYCWGNDQYGQVGDGTNPITAISPRRIGASADWSTVDAGLGHTCGVRANGQLYCWGYDAAGQIGDGEPDANIDAPKRIGAFGDWSNISAGDSHTCGVRKNGKLYCWGFDSSGQVGDGGEASASLPTPQRIGTFEDWANASAGQYHSCGARKNGKLYCWGYDGNGQLGDGSGPPKLSPLRVGTFEDWANGSAGGNHTCGIRHGGKLYCWGLDSNGQVGDGELTGATSPRRI